MRLLTGSDNCNYKKNLSQKQKDRLFNILSPKLSTGGINKRQVTYDSVNSSPLLCVSLMRFSR